MAETATQAPAEPEGESPDTGEDAEAEAMLAEAASAPAEDDAPPELKAALHKANEEAKSYRLKLKEYEDRDKTELQLATEAREEAEFRAREAELGLTRARIVAKHKLPADAAEFLAGENEDEVAGKAERLAALLRPGRGERRADPSQGSSAGGTSASTADQFADIVGDFLT